MVAEGCWDLILTTLPFLAPDMLAAYALDYFYSHRYKVDSVIIPIVLRMTFAQHPQSILHWFCWGELFARSWADSLAPPEPQKAWLLEHTQSSVLNLNPEMNFDGTRPVPPALGYVHHNDFGPDTAVFQRRSTQHNRSPSFSFLLTSFLSCF